MYQEFVDSYCGSAPPETQNPLTNNSRKRRQTSVATINVNLPPPTLPDSVGML
jgi:hypothetical protein